MMEAKRRLQEEEDEREKQLSGISISLDTS